MNIELVVVAVEVKMVLPAAKYRHTARRFIQPLDFDSGRRLA